MSHHASDVPAYGPLLTTISTRYAPPAPHLIPPPPAGAAAGAATPMPALTLGLGPKDSLSGWGNPGAGAARGAGSSSSGGGAASQSQQQQQQQPATTVPLLPPLPAPVLLFCDFHGHSHRDGVFTFGCHEFTHEGAPPVPGVQDYAGQLPPNAAPAAHAAAAEAAANGLPPPFSRAPPSGGPPLNPSSRLFPKLLAARVDSFAFKGCSWRVQREKASCARVAMWRDACLTAAYTIEASFAGANTGARAGTHFSTRAYEDIGHAFCLSLLDWLEGPAGARAAGASARLRHVEAQRALAAALAAEAAAAAAAAEAAEIGAALGKGGGVGDAAVIMAGDGGGDGSRGAAAASSKGAGSRKRPTTAAVGAGSAPRKPPRGSSTTGKASSGKATKKAGGGKRDGE
jgi:hypothetical protein